ncbi:MAG: methylmalonyl Co-A mutase-associated GTPase MeaB [Clostridia bacterium]|nr:methylmalonyl Co-A mutase-associated GTPase MeaB [Clostridia bacterium]
MDLVAGILEGNRRALAKGITLVENGEPEKYRILAELHPHTGKSMIVGVTGSPGAGKSSLVDQMTKFYRKQGRTVGVIAIDPTSPFSGGALLGDRIRMQDNTLDPGVFIRSMGTRGSLGGLSRATKEVLTLFDAFGFDVIIVETVGVGQSELDIMDTADTVVVVLTPAGGDIIQTLKAGIMEIADVFAVNKSDLDGADRVVSEVNKTLDLSHGEWRPPVVKTITLDGTGLDELLAEIDKHREYLISSGNLEILRQKRLKEEVTGIVLHKLEDMITLRFQQDRQVQGLLESVVNREQDPYTAAQSIMFSLESWLPESAAESS